MGLANRLGVLLFDILILRDKRRCSSDLIIDLGLIRNELLYILDPKDTYGPDFPGENFPRPERKGGEALRQIPVKTPKSVVKVK